MCWSFIESILVSWNLWHFRTIKHKVEVILNTDVAVVIGSSSCDPRSRMHNYIDCKWQIFVLVIHVISVYADSFKAECHSSSLIIVWFMQLLPVNVYFFYILNTGEKHFPEDLWWSGYTVSSGGRGQEELLLWFASGPSGQSSTSPQECRCAHEAGDTTPSLVLGGSVACACSRRRSHLWLVCLWDCRGCIILELLTHGFKIKTVWHLNFPDISVFQAY